MNQDCQSSSFFDYLKTVLCQSSRIFAKAVGSLLMLPARDRLPQDYPLPKQQSLCLPLVVCLRTVLYQSSSILTFLTCQSYQMNQDCQSSSLFDCLKTVLCQSSSIFAYVTCRSYLMNQDCQSSSFFDCLKTVLF